MNTTIRIVLSLILAGLLSGNASAASDKKHSVFVVMSYEAPEKNMWCREIKSGIDSVLGKTCNIDYFYMDTKINFKGGVEKAKTAYKTFSEGKYDGVIAADDNAQKMFVLPFLKSKVKTPVMFCGVNAAPDKYGYPTDTVSGILERGHFRESVALVKQLSPKISKIGFIVKNSPSGRALKEQIKQESKTYLAKVIAFELVDSLDDIKKSKVLMACDAFFVDSLRGILDDKGTNTDNKQVIRFLNQTYGVPVVGANNIHVQSGALCAVVKSGTEQGKGAAKKLLQAMNGKAVSTIPISQNYRGTRVINITIMKKLGITPKPIHLLGADLIHSADGD